MREFVHVSDSCFDCWHLLLMMVHVLFALYTSAILLVRPTYAPIPQEYNWLPLFFLVVNLLYIHI